MSNEAPAAHRSPLRVGLTGGIASGKSTVAQRFAALDVPVIDADLAARELTQPGTPLLKEIVQRFGPAAEARVGRPLLTNERSLDRITLRRLIFEDAQLRHALETLLHPRISERMEALSQEAEGPYQIHVVPLLVETGAAERYERVLVVDCPETLQLTRLQVRDGMDLPQAQAMLSAQAPRAARLAIADDIILNDADLEALVAQVAGLDRLYRDLSCGQAQGPRRA